jgi:hypothetical protein
VLGGTTELRIGESGRLFPAASVRIGSYSHFANSTLTATGYGACSLLVVTAMSGSGGRRPDPGG